LFIDGFLYSGDVEQVDIPKLRWHIEEYRGGGMDVPVNVKLGHEKLEMSFDITCHDATVLGLYGLAQGQNKIFKFFGHLISYDGTEKGVQIELHGFICELDQGAVKPNSKTTAKVTVSADYMKHVIDNAVILEIDALNKKFIVNGVDQDANARRLLGII
jgi:P2 family phage contractile tail tube protein